MALNALIAAVILLQPLSTLAWPTPPGWAAKLSQTFAEARNKTGPAAITQDVAEWVSALTLSEGHAGTKELLKWIASIEDSNAQVDAELEQLQPKEETEPTDSEMSQLLHEELVRQEKADKEDALNEKSAHYKTDQEVDRDTPKVDKHFDQDLKKDVKVQDPMMTAEKHGLKQDI